jgi:hypothetical protein
MQLRCPQFVPTNTLDGRFSVRRTQGHRPILVRGQETQLLATRRWMGGLKKAKGHKNTWLCDQKQARAKRTFYRIPDPPRPSVNGADTPVCPSLPIAACTRAPLESSHTSVYRLLSAIFL